MQKEIANDRRLQKVIAKAIANDCRLQKVIAKSNCKWLQIVKSDCKKQLQMIDKSDFKKGLWMIAKNYHKAIANDCRLPRVTANDR